MSKTTRVFVVGATGMLGNAVIRVFAHSLGIEVAGSARSAAALEFMAPSLRDRIVCNVDVDNVDALRQLLERVRPDVVINCVGVVKQLEAAQDPLLAIPINSLLPHRLARLCMLFGARLIHISTDCVFSGSRGMYREDDVVDARDLYGLSKFLGEVDYLNAITLRTSIVGHELNSAHGLVGWFLAQHGRVRGYSRAVFSGLPTVELARVIRDYVMPRPELHGLYHVSASPIAKLDLLRLVADEYNKEIFIEPDAQLIVDRSLDSTRFRKATGYSPPSWPDLVRTMHESSSIG
jgi:dTDP-4-dehydrorhamnose reductase